MGIPKHLLKPTMATMEKVRKEILDMIDELNAKTGDEAKLSQAQVKELKDREAQVCELMGKLKDKIMGKKGGFRDAQKSAEKASQEVSGLHEHTKEMLATLDPVTEMEAAEVQELLTGIKDKPVLPPEHLGIETIVHAAGVLADGLIMTSTNTVYQGMSKVFGAKSHCSWHLYHATGALS